MDKFRGTTSKLAEHLSALPGGVGCRHLARQRDGFDAAIFVSLSLVRPIVSRVPRCKEHACPLAASCEYVVDFEPDARGRKSGAKYRPTAAGTAAASDSTVIAGAIRSLPAVESLLHLLADGSLSIFEVNARLRDTWAEPDAIPDRPELGQVMELLIELGYLTVDGTGMLTKCHGASRMT